MVATAVCLLACGQSPNSAGISQAQAIEIARQQAQAGSSTTVELKGVKAGPFRDFRGGASDAVAPGDTKVWAITFSGTFRGSGGPPLCPSGEPCDRPIALDHTITVILDYSSGAFIMASVEP
jgi:hypothetical protein